MSKELDVATVAAKAAGEIMIKGWETDLAVSSKADNSLVTLIDGQAEEKIITIIQQSFPDHKIIAEESGSQGSSGYCWYIDPIDGTTNYSRRIPICGVSIALALDNEIIVGVIFCPFTNELYTSEKGQGAFLNGDKIKTSEVAEMEKAVLAVSYSHNSQVREKIAKIIPLINSCRTKREYGSAAYELALVASGRLDGAIFVDHKDWDYAAGVLLVKEAGGLVTAIAGKDWALTGKDLLAVGNVSLQKTLKADLADF